MAFFGPNADTLVGLFDPQEGERVQHVRRQVRGEQRVDRPTDLVPRGSGAGGAFASEAGVERLLGAAGFERVRTVARELDVRFADADQWHAISWSTGQRAVWSGSRRGSGRRCVGGPRVSSSRPARREATCCASGSATPWVCGEPDRAGWMRA